MDCVRNQLLTNAGFALYQDARGRIGNSFHAFQHTSQCRAGADDSPEVHRHVDFFAQVIAFSYELFAQARIFCQRAAQLALCATTLCDIL